MWFMCNKKNMSQTANCAIIIFMSARQWFHYLVWQRQLYVIVIRYMWDSTPCLTRILIAVHHRVNNDSISVTSHFQPCSLSTSSCISPSLLTKSSSRRPIPHVTQTSSSASQPLIKLSWKDISWLSKWEELLLYYRISIQTYKSSHECKWEWISLRQNSIMLAGLLDVIVPEQIPQQQWRYGVTWHDKCKVW